MIFGKPPYSVTRDAGSTPSIIFYKQKKGGGDMDLKSLLQAVAESVLANLIGDGYWYTEKELPKFNKPEDAIEGLNPGDIVLTYEAGEIEEHAVLAVIRGVGYFLVDHHYYGPILGPVTDDCFFRTVEEVVSAYRDEIESDIAYYEERNRQVIKLKSLLSGSTNSERK